MKENYMVCNCMQVSYAKIADALDTHERFDNVISAFEEIQKQTHCSMAAAAATKRCSTSFPRS